MSWQQFESIINSQKVAQDTLKTEGSQKGLKETIFDEIAGSQYKADLNTIQSLSQQQLCQIIYLYQKHSIQQRSQINNLLQSQHDVDNTPDKNGHNKLTEENGISGIIREKLINEFELAFPYLKDLTEPFQKLKINLNLVREKFKEEQEKINETKDDLIETLEEWQFLSNQLNESISKFNELNQNVLQQIATSTVINIQNPSPPASSINGNSTPHTNGIDHNSKKDQPNKQSDINPQDFITLNQKFCQERNLRADVEQKYTNLTVFNAKLEDQIKQLEKDLTQVTEDKQFLQQQSANLQENLQNEFQRCNNSEQQLARQTSVFNEKIEEMQKNMKENNENGIIQQRDLQNKIIQERLQSDQKLKENTQMEEQLNQCQQEMQDQIELTQQKIVQIQQLEMKNSMLKNKIQEQKSSMQNLNQQIVDNINQYNQESADIQKRLEELQAENTQLNEKSRQVDQTNQMNIQKDMQITSLEIQISQLTQKYENTLKEYEYIKTQNGLLRSQCHEKDLSIKQLQKQRQIALNEISQLSGNGSANSSSFSNSNNSSAKKSEQFNPAPQNVSHFQSQNSFYDQAFMKNQTPTQEPPSKPSLPSSNSTSHSRTVSIFDSSKFLEGEKEQKKRNGELKIIKYLKRELQVLYKEYVTNIFPNNTVQSLNSNNSFVNINQDFNQRNDDSMIQGDLDDVKVITFEKQLNDAIRHSQDLLDMIQES